MCKGSFPGKKKRQNRKEQSRLRMKLRLASALMRRIWYSSAHLSKSHSPFGGCWSTALATRRLLVGAITRSEVRCFFNTERSAPHYGWPGLCGGSCCGWPIRGRSRTWWGGRGECAKTEGGDGNSKSNARIISKIKHFDTVGLYSAALCMYCHGIPPLYD